MVPASVVKDITTKLALTERDLLCALTHVAKEHASPPISQFKVGAVALCESGNVYMGVNLEFPGLNLSFCKLSISSTYPQLFMVNNF